MTLVSTSNIGRHLIYTNNKLVCIHFMLFVIIFQYFCQKVWKHTLWPFYLYHWRNGLLLNLSRDCKGYFCPCRRSQGKFELSGSTVRWEPLHLQLKISRQIYRLLMIFLKTVRGIDSCWFLKEFSLIFAHIWFVISFPFWGICIRVFVYSDHFFYNLDKVNLSAKVTN